MTCISVVSGDEERDQYYFADGHYHWETSVAMEANFYWRACVNKCAVMPKSTGQITENRFQVLGKVIRTQITRQRLFFLKEKIFACDSRFFSSVKSNDSHLFFSSTHKCMSGLYHINLFISTTWEEGVTACGWHLQKWQATNFLFYFGGHCRVDDCSEEVPISSE